MIGLSDIQPVNSALRRGEVVLLPTETVYGLAVDAQNNAAVDALYNLKGRDFNKPIAICVSTATAANALVKWSPTAQALSDLFWPGPLSLVLPAKENLGLDPRLFGRFADGSPSLSLRVPETRWSGQITTNYLALTSANRSGEADSTTHVEAHDIFGVHIGASYDGGPSTLGTPSTILALEKDGVRLLRTGALKAEHFAPLELNWIS